MTSHEAYEAIDDAATSAYHRLIEGGWTLEKLAEAMAITPKVLHLRVYGGKQILPGWPLGGVIELAVATDQNPVRMLAREVIDQLGDGREVAS